MSEYGIRINNIEAASIFECNMGARESLDVTPAMLVNSLFKDYLMEIGMEVTTNGFSRDIICVKFGYGTRSAEEERKHTVKLIKDIDKNDYPEEKKEQVLTLYQNKLKHIEEHPEQYVKMSRKDLRTECYVNGVPVTYHTWSKKKPYHIMKSETIKYKMLYRTPGKAKKGTCMFINEKLYDQAHEFLTMGIELPEDDAPIVEMGAYSSLVTSGIVDRIEIDPRNILILDDVESSFVTNVVSVELDEHKHCIAKDIEGYELKNVLFDGQALIDHSIFPEWGDGYILLRHHMCKMAAFDTNLQMFFKEYYGDGYEDAEIEDIFGVKHKAKDIQLVTTTNSVKWLKFDITYDKWCEWVNKNGNMFGIVKTAHKSKLGNVQQMSYQMINALECETMESVVSYTKGYIEKLKNDDETFLQYLRDNTNYSNDYDVLVALVDWNPEFVDSEYFRERRTDIINNYIYNIRFGKIIQEGDNLVIIGSPYAMLLHTVGENCLKKDDTFSTEKNAIQCFTTRFKNGEYLAGFRSPFNARNNMDYLHNVYSDKLLKYFIFGDQIIAVNLIKTPFQDRNNGSDQDSDSLYITNQTDIVSCAKMCYEKYPTIKNNVPQDKKHYKNTLENYALIDHELASAQMAIGESSNIAQQCLTYTYNSDDDCFNKYVCILSVAAQISIDNAKRKYDISIPKEISRIKGDLKAKGCKQPIFWKQVQNRNGKRYTKKTHNNKDKSKYDSTLICPMNYLYDIQIDNKKAKKVISNKEFFVKHDSSSYWQQGENRRKSRKVESMIEKYSLNIFKYNSSKDYDEEPNLLLRSDFDALIDNIRQTYISKNYLRLMSHLINRALVITPQTGNKISDSLSKLRKNRSLLLKVLYTVNKDAFLCCFVGKNRQSNIFNE